MSPLPLRSLQERRGHGKLGVNRRRDDDQLVATRRKSARGRFEKRRNISYFRVYSPKIFRETSASILFQQIHPYNNIHLIILIYRISLCPRCRRVTVRCLCYYVTIYFYLNKFGCWPRMPNNSDYEGFPRLVHLGYAIRVFRIAPAVGL